MMVMATDISTEGRIKTILSQVNTLKPLPANLTRALKLMDEPDIAIKEIASAISMDQALTAQILKLANSAYYGFVHPASTLHEAIARLGFRRTKTVLFTVSYSSSMGQSIKGYNLGRGVLWQHSVAVAMVAQQLAERIAYPRPEEAYVAGLLHDIGKLILEQYYRVNWQELLALGETQQLMLYEAEQSLFQVNHAQVGGALAQKWNLPDCLVEAITFHHLPDQAAEVPELAAVIHLSDLICLRLGIGLTHDTFMPQPNASALRRLSLTQIDLDALVNQYTGLLDRIPMTDQNLAPRP